ncbi:MAG: SDR family NAD(P)-dependent oxidoreductase, partial [Planctomycetota bacterium]|nr:SDR family NAD(P)-dependent oxidoreductase [Planctomycetota bacterium]
NISKMIRLNCEIPARLSRLFLAPMAERKRGGMIVLASAAAYLPTPPMSVYGATKGFDLLLGESLAMEMRSFNVDVLVVSPGHTDTEVHGVAGAQSAVVGGTACPEDVVKQSFRLLGKRISFVHGVHNFFLTWLTRFVPRSVVARLSFLALKNR